MNRPLVLIADDQLDIRDLYYAYLRFNGIAGITANDGEDAIAKTRTLKPDVVVMDLMMPGVGGIDAIRAIKSDRETAVTPVIAMTADVNESARAAALEARCDAFIAKPCSPERLMAEIRRFLHEPQ